MYNYRLKPVSLDPRCRRQGLKKSGFNLRIAQFHIRRKMDIIRCFLDIVFFVWMKTGFPPDINQFLTNTRNIYPVWPRETD